MKANLLSVIIVFTWFTSSGQTLGPNVLNAAGGSHKHGYYSVEWSIGELALVDVLRSGDQSYSITNGFLQPYTDIVKSNNVPRAFTPDEIRILPNPTKGLLEVNFLIHEKGKIKMQMYDGKGVLFEARNVVLDGYGKFERLDMSGLPNSTYMLYIELAGTTGVNKKGVFKITKIK